MRRNFVVVLAAATLLLAGSLVAQEFRAAIVGRVTDSSGAVIAGATVAATHVETGAAYRTGSTRDGSYLLLSLPPGAYRLEVSFAGFRKYVREGLTLELQQRPTVDVTLEPGDVT